MDLFKRVVDVKCPFHLRVINVAFTNMGEIASNSISAFLSSSLCHPLHSSSCRPAQNSICQLTPAIGAKEECDCLVACTSHLLSRDGAEERKRDDHQQHTTQALDCETQTMDKRRVTGIEPSLPVPDSTVKVSQSHTTHASKRKSAKSLDFFRVKQKKTGREKSFASMCCTENPQMPDPHMSGLPLEVDPEVFAELPPEIQREIVGESRPAFSHTIKKQAECKSPRNVVKSSQAKSSTNFLSIKSFFCPSMYTDKIILEEKMKEENTYSASLENSLVAIKGEQVNFGEKAPKVNDLTIITRDETQPSESPSASGSWMSCQRRYSSEAVERVNGSAKKSLVLTNTNSNATDLEVPKSTLHEQDEKQNCLLSRFSSEMMSVPAGIAPDVFASLPPFLQREVAADAALQRHNMATSLVKLNNFQGLGKKAKRKGRPNQSHSMLNYLKKK